MHIDTLISPPRCAADPRPPPFWPARLPLRHSGGFSLLEVLISIIILSFGLLGMVGLQTASLQANRDARLQSIATEYARDLADIMRNNKDIALQPTSPFLGDFTTPLTPTTASYCLNAGNASTVTATFALGCTDTTDVANAEMTEWLSRIDADLPGAHVKICVDSTPFTGSGVPQWTCSGGAGGVVTPLVIKIGWTRTSTDRSKTGDLALVRATTPSIVIPVTPGNTS